MESTTSDANPLQSPFDFRRRAFAVLVVDPDGRVRHVMGSGLEIASGLAFTAGHVIEEFLKEQGMEYDSMGVARMPTRDETNALRDGVFECERLSILAAFLMPDKSIVTRRCLAAIRVENCDVAFLWLDLEEGLNFFGFPISLYPPQPGDEMTAFGFPKGEVIHAERSEEQRVLLNPKLQRGEVIEVEFTGTGSAMGIPRFRCDFEAPPGMSGGPVFDAVGRLRGIVSSSMFGGTSVAALWPTVVRPLLDETTLQQHHLDGKLSIDGAELVRTLGDVVVFSTEAARREL